jgi:uroporphyrinogen-III synthase
MAEGFSILSTGSLGVNEGLASPDPAAARVDVIPFIKIVLKEEEATRNSILSFARQVRQVIFTSTNAVKAVTRVLTHPPQWEIFCVGGETSKRAAAFFGEPAIRDHADNAEELSEKIIREGQVKEAVFFCGDQRRDILPERLRAAGIGLEELAVYQTLLTPVRLTRQYDAILFFSPTAVRSFFSLNSLPPQTVLFALGATTALAIRELTENEMRQAPKPDKHTLLQMALEYGRTHTIS